MLTRILAPDPPPAPAGHWHDDISSRTLRWFKTAQTPLWAFRLQRPLSKEGGRCNLLFPIFILRRLSDGLECTAGLVTSAEACYPRNIDRTTWGDPAYQVNRWAYLLNFTPGHHR